MEDVINNGICACIELILDRMKIEQLYMKIKVLY